jgi:hypothetical protein
MNKRVFVDTGAWFAGLVSNDQHHALAMSHRATLLKRGSLLVTSNLVVHETTMLLERKASRRAAIRFLREIYSDSMVEIIHADRTVESEGLEIYQKYQDQDYSITDSISFAIMRRLGISHCFAFDRHFQTMGFHVDPIARER